MFSQNGATVIATAKGEANYGSPDLVKNVIPGTNWIFYAGGLLKGDVDTVLRYVGGYWHRFVEPIVDQATGQWGYSPRPIRGQDVVLSNHFSATAADTNAALHPLGTRTLTGGQINTLGKLTIALKGVVRFGAFYTGRPDEMHAEIFLFGAPLERLAANIRGGRMDVNFPELVTNPDPTPKPTGTPTTSKPAGPADWWDTVDEPQARKIVSEEVAKALRSEGVTGAADVGGLAAQWEGTARRWVNEEATKVVRSEGVSGAADTGALIGRLVPALRAAGIVAVEVDDAHIRSVIAAAVAQ